MPDRGDVDGSMKACQLDGAKNAGILAAQIIGSHDKCVLDKVVAYKEGLKLKVEAGAKSLKEKK